MLDNVAENPRLIYDALDDETWLYDNKLSNNLANDVPNMITNRKNQHSLKTLKVNSADCYYKCMVN